MAVKLGADGKSGERISYFSYFAHLTFKDKNVRDLTAGIESVISNPNTEANLQAQVQAKLDGVVRIAQQSGLIGKDYRPRWFKGTAYEQYLKENLGDINWRYNLGIRV